MTELWQGLVGGLASVLVFFHDLVAPVFGDGYAWGWAIILLTLAVRLVLLPLTIKLTKSMRGMQQLQPEMTRIREKYKVDRSLMRSDPEKYRALQAKQQEETQKLWREHNVNPAGGCLPLIAQMPILFALYQVFINRNYVPELLEAPFYLVNSLGDTAAAGGGVGPYLLLVLMGVTTFISTRQTAKMNQNPQAAQQQQILMYVMPALLVVFGWQLPVGVLLYWVTTNLWTMGQQYILFRTVNKPATVGGSVPVAALGGGGPKGPRGGQAKGKDTTEVVDVEGNGSPKKGETPKKGTPTPKRNETRQQGKGASRDATSRRGNGRAATRGKDGRSGTPSKPKR